MNNCLVVIRNKKLKIEYPELDKILRTFSSACIYFDKISFLAFDNSKEIACQLKECKDNFDNSVVICDGGQIKTIADYIAKLYGALFDTGLVLNTGTQYVFLCDSCGDIEKFCVKTVGLIDAKRGLSYDKLFIKTVGAPSALINQTIKKSAELCPEMSFAVYDDYDDKTIEIAYSGTTPKMSADVVLRNFVTSLDDYVYALEDVSLARRLFQLLKLRRMRISVAESFTGGGIAKKLVEVPGVSEVYFEGLNTYANQSKMGRLGVQELTLKQFGAVSEQTACEMAEGLIKTGNCDISIATTGIAGPKSDNTLKPVGLAYIAIGTQDGVSVYKFNFKGDRAAITAKAINQALFLAYKTIK
ncbi:MAG: CinA family protein [Candidatus Coproplasma sp.]